MYQRYKERFGTAGVIVGVIALILALGGTALAAKGALTGKQKKEVEKIAKKYAGKPGAPGTAGATGAPGKDGTNGTNGSNGSPGAAGKSVVTSAASNTECTGGVGGTKFEVEGSGSPSHVCNGKEGPEGPEGPKGPEGPEGALGTAGTTLPPGAIETGVWSFIGTSTSNPAGFRIPLSFPIPLEAGLTEEQVHYKTDADFETFCHGTASFPEPEPEELCVYANEGVEANFTGIFKNIESEELGAYRTGAVLTFAAPSSTSSGGGGYAVAGPPLVP